MIASAPLPSERSPGSYGRREAFKVHQGLRDKGPVKVPREFVFMDRAAIGLGGVFLHLNAELNFYRLFNDTIIDADLGDVARRQKEAFTAAGVPLPEERAEGPPKSASPDCPPSPALCYFGPREQGVESIRGVECISIQPNAIRRWTTMSTRRPTNCSSS